MKHFRKLVLSAAGMALIACSSGGDDEALTIVPPVVVDPTIPVVVADLATLETLTSNPQLLSDGNLPVTISALVRDTGNNFVSGQGVTFAADSGGLTIVNAETDGSGVATATLTTAGDPTNRTITVTASAGDLTDTVSVDVIGTQLTITGGDSLVQGQTTTFTFILSDAAGTGIAGETVAVTSSAGNTLAASSLTTDGQGQAQIDYTAVNGGADTLSATALGITTTQSISVSDDSFAFSSPAAGSQIVIGANQVLTLSWVQNNVPIAGQTVTFSTTRGSLTPTSVITDGNGQASTSIVAANAGPASITATGANGPTTTLDVQFVATVPASIEMQADPFSIPPNSQSAITAVVRDASDNLVTGTTIDFNLVDVTGGTLSVGTAVTDTQGRAQTFYQSSSTTSSLDGIIVEAVVTSNNAIRDSVALTVAGRSLFFTFGTGNELFEPNPAQYRVPYVVQVTDADGRGVEGVDVVMSVKSVKYSKGYWVIDTANDVWVTFTRDRCNDEDGNGNGILDGGEDFNSNGRIEAGNIVTVGPGTFTSDAGGFGFIDLFYPQQYGRWLEVELEARTIVQGTEFSEREVFLTNVVADDVSDTEKSPPGLLFAADNFVSDGSFGDPEDAVAPFDPAPGFGIVPAGVVVPYVVTGIGSPFGYNPNCAIWDFPN